MTVSTASFTTVDDVLTHFVRDRDVDVIVTMTDADQQTVTFARERGSKGSGSWETIKQWVSGDAAVTFHYRTKRYNENLRMYLTLDGGGTNTVTLTDQDKSYRQVKNHVGDVLADFKESGLDVRGGLRHSGSGVVDVTDATITLTAELHAGRLMTLNASGGIDVTLPAATGSGNTYRFFVLTTTTDAMTVTAAGSDKYYGQMVGTDANVEFTWNAVGGTDVVLTLGGAAQETGGTKGDYVEFTDVGSLIWYVQGTLEHGSGTEATPFGT